MESLEDVKALLKEEKDFKGISEFVEGQVTKAREAESEIFKGKVKKLNSEAEGLRKYKRAMVEDLGHDPESGVELRDHVSNLNKRLKQSTDTDEKLTGKDKENAGLKEQMGLIMKKLEASDVKALEAEKKSRQSILKQKLSSALDGKVKGKKFVLETLISSGQVALGEDGETAYFKNGDELTELGDGISKFLEDNKDIAVSDQSGGAGTSGGKPDPGKNQLSRSQFDAMDPKARAKFYNEGGRVAVAKGA